MGGVTWETYSLCSSPKQFMVVIFLLLWRQITSDDIRGGLVGAHWCPAFCVAVTNIRGSCLKHNRGSSCLFHKVYLPLPAPMEPPGPLRQYLKYLKCCPTWRSCTHAPFILPLFCSFSAPLSPSLVSQSQPFTSALFLFLWFYLFLKLYSFNRFYLSLYLTLYYFTQPVWLCLNKFLMVNISFCWVA